MTPFRSPSSTPPYGGGLALAALNALVKGGWLAPAALCVIEEAATDTLTLPDGFVDVDRRVYGVSQVVFARWDLRATTG